MNARGRKVNFLLSSSVTALLVGGGASSAWAVCVNAIGAGFDNPLAQTTPCVAVTNTSFTGNITNEGTIAPGGISFTGGSITGFIASSGNIAGGISLDAQSAITTFGRPASVLIGGVATSAGQSVTVSTFAGGISNSGTITFSANKRFPGAGIMVGGIATSGGVVTVSTFTGGITNTGTIAAGSSKSNSSGIVIGGGASSGGFVTVASFAGGISNGGTISGVGRNGAGIFVGGTAVFGSVTVSRFAGGISNSGTISVGSGGVGVFVGGNAGGSGASVTVSGFSGGISNSGTISVAGGTGGGVGIAVGGNAFGSGVSVTISSFDGGISNSGTIAVISGKAKGGGQTAGILVGGNGFSSAGTVTISRFAGGITNTGTIAVTNDGFRPATAGVAVGNLGFGSGGGVTISTFAGGISNGGTITIADSLGNSNGFGIFVGGTNLGSPAIATFGGGITNSGTISAGVGILVLGVSTFLGGISNGGTITGGSTGIVVAGVSSFSGNVSNSGSITAGLGGIVVTGVSTFSGNISNSGSITAGNTGIFICSCVTFAGGSIVNTGTITASTGILVANSSPIGIFNSGTIVGTGGTAIDLTAASGGNTLTLGPGYSITGNVLGNTSGDTLQLGGSGIGSFDLSSVGATQQYQNFIAFNVVSGIWTVSNVFGQSQPWNVNGGTLAGTGTLAAVNVNSGGTLEPGTIGVPGTVMTITGNLAFQSGASYLVNINPTTASRANVAGTVTLNGAVLGNFAPGSYNGKAVYDILDPPSISGKFTGFTSNVPGLAGTLSYTSTEVLLTLNAILGSGGGLNVNQQNAANGINNYFNNGGTIPAGFFPILRLTGGNLANALSRLDGEVATDAQKGAFGFLDQFLELMLDPYVDGRSAGTPGMHAFAPEREASLPDDVALAYARALKAPALALKAAPPATFRWSTWGAGFGGYNQTNGDPVAGSTNVITRDYGFAGGVDYHFSPDAAVGFALAGGGTNWGLAQGLGSGRSDTFSAGLYGTTHFGPAYVAGALAFENNWSTTNRSALGDQLTASFNGQSFGARLEAGQRYGVPVNTADIGITPYAALQTQVFHTPAYSENDLTGGGFGLNYAANDATDTRSELGARFDSLTAFNGMPLLWRGRVAWAHDWVATPALSAAYQAMPGSRFVVNGAPTPANSALTTIDAELKISPSWSLRAKFDGELAPGSQTYSGTGTVRYKW